MIGTPPEPQPGIPREPAAWRSAQLRDVRYELDLTLSTAVDRIVGRMTLHWRFAHEPVDLVLDWRPAAITGLPEGVVRAVRANGAATATQLVNDHLVISRAALRPGANAVELEFAAPVATAGTAVTRYCDREDGSDYVYTLLVPADASTLFPCLDQPDLKARFSLQLSVPSGWTAVANAPLAGTHEAGAAVCHAFAPTAPISTYLFAFAAGPFVQLRDEASGVRLFARRSRAQQAAAAASEVLRLNREATRWFEDYFAQPFPFAKYDLVLLPEFAYQGMEHAGATFLREDAVLFPFEPAVTDRLRRAQLLYHETAHQWFGDLVTMRWFDDLWLKEGFANLMAFKAARALFPEVDARNALRALKLSAYRTDVTPGTTPIWQALPNLSAAKSAYGSIVYSKAPAVLHQAEFFLGEDVFRNAVRAFLAAHRYASADWHDLVAAFERASGRDLQAWSRAWVERAGVPEVQAEVDADAHGRLACVRLAQRDALGTDTVWPQRLRLLLAQADGSEEAIDVWVDAAVTEVPGRGRALPTLVYANHDDRGYGVFRLDAGSRATLQAGLGAVRDDFLRAQLWDALWEDVRGERMRPAQWVELAMRELPAEGDELTVNGLLGNLQTAMRWYLPERTRAAWQPGVEALLRTGMREGVSPSLRIAYFRAYVALACTLAARDELVALLAGDAAVPGLVLRGAERFRVVRALVAAGDVRADRLLADASASDRSDDGRRLAYAAEAARPDAATKQGCFEAILHDPVLPERWIEESVAPFNTVEQEQLTLPWLEPALRALPTLKRERRIFFVNNWLAAFVGGQRSPAALATVERFLREEPLDPDLRRKVLEAMDGLARTVRIRATAQP